MIKEEAIKILSTRDRYGCLCGWTSGYTEALDMAIEALERTDAQQSDIKQAAKLLSDFIESCSGGDSYLITPDGENLRTDWGYVTDGLQLIYDWAERSRHERW